MEETEQNRPVIFKDIRRYSCEFCGIFRSKKALISAHILSCHQDELKVRGESKESDEKVPKVHTCAECGVSFQKYAYLKQHMQSHSLENYWSCSLRFKRFHGISNVTSVKHWIPENELRNARGSCFILNGIVPEAICMPGR